MKKLSNDINKVFGNIEDEENSEVWLCKFNRE